MRRFQLGNYLPQTDLFSNENKLQTNNLKTNLFELNSSKKMN